MLKQGSINLAYESMRMAVPNVRFLGMSAFDYRKFKMPTGGRDQADEGRHRARRADEGVPLVQGQEVAARDPGASLDNGFKMEVDGFLTKSISFITEEYIPKKLRDRDYLQ